MTDQVQEARWAAQSSCDDGGRLWSNAKVVAVQSRLYSPGYAGPARWVLFDPDSRRAFSALGKDTVPDVVQLLAKAASGAKLIDLARACPGVSDTQLDGLVASGLLETNPPCGGTSTFVGTFHSANVDYPFFDYGSEAVVTEESDLLDHYATMWEPPPALAEREGTRCELPPTTVGFASGHTDDFPNLPVLAQVFRTLLGPIGEIHTRYATCVRRTTPSGGARHPTEVMWVSRRPVGGIPEGAYTYDAAGHCLVREPAGVEERYRRDLGGSEFCFIVRSRVARAMWRYRDLRALRPVLIDAGHVVEMLAFLLAKAGVTTEVRSPQHTAWRDAWLDEPELAVVRPARPGAPGSADHRPSSTVPATTLADGQVPTSLRTNPAAVLRFDGAMTVDVLWPSRSRERIDATDFLVLNHCLPSARGDRETSPGDILEAVPDSSVNRIRSLIDVGALLPVAQADPLYRDLQLWVRHEWYLASLALLESLADGHVRPAVSQVAARSDYVQDPAVLLRRRTVRAFRPEPIDRSTLEQLVGKAVKHRPQGITVTIAAHDVAGLDHGVYRSEDAGLRRLGGCPSRDEIAAATAGQSAGSAGAATLWLSLPTDTSLPATYIRDLLDLGRLGQRLCEVATEVGLGVFLTPAAYDTRTCLLLKLPDADRMLTYVFAVGVPHEEG